MENESAGHMTRDHNKWDYSRQRLRYTITFCRVINVGLAGETGKLWDSGTVKGSTDK